MFMIEPSVALMSLTLFVVMGGGLLLWRRLTRPGGRRT